VKKSSLSLAIAVTLGSLGFASAQDIQQLKDLGELLSTPQGLRLVADTLWVLVAAFLVFWMNAGFALVESGFCRAKNTANILAKNFIVFAITTLAYWTVGFAFMFGDGNSFIGWKGLALTGEHNAPLVALGKAKEYSGDYSALSWTSVPLYAAFLFQLVFAGTAATIVSGAVAERIKYAAFILFSFVMGSLIYPIDGLASTRAQRWRLTLPPSLASQSQPILQPLLQALSLLCGLGLGWVNPTCQ